MRNEAYGELTENASGIVNRICKHFSIDSLNPVVTRSSLMKLWANKLTTHLNLALMDVMFPGMVNEISVDNFCAVYQSLTKPTTDNMFEALTVYHIATIQEPPFNYEEADDYPTISYQNVKQYICDVLVSYLLVIFKSKVDTAVKWADFNDSILNGNSIEIDGKLLASFTLKNLPVECNEHTTMINLAKWLRKNKLVKMVSKELYQFIFGIKTVSEVNILLPFPEAESDVKRDSILSMTDVLLLNSELSEPTAKMTLKFRFDLNTESLKFLKAAVYNQSHTIIVIQDSNGDTFGLYSSQPWVPRKGFYGDGKSFLFTLKPRVNVYKANGKNESFQLFNESGIGMGESISDPGLFINWALKVGSTASSCQTFSHYMPLSRDLVFDIKILEVWVVHTSEASKKAPSLKMDFSNTVEMWKHIGRIKKQKEVVIRAPGAPTLVTSKQTDSEFAKVKSLMTRSRVLGETTSYCATGLTDSPSTNTVIEMFSKQPDESPTSGRKLGSDEIDDAKPLKPINVSKDSLRSTQFDKRCNVHTTEPAIEKRTFKGKPLAQNILHIKNIGIIGDKATNKNCTCSGNDDRSKNMDKQGGFLKYKELRDFVHEDDRETLHTKDTKSVKEPQLCKPAMKDKNSNVPHKVRRLIYKPGNEKQTSCKPPRCGDVPVWMAMMNGRPSTVSSKSILSRRKMTLCGVTSKCRVTPKNDANIYKKSFVNDDLISQGGNTQVCRNTQRKSLVQSQRGSLTPSQKEYLMQGMRKSIMHTPGQSYPQGQRVSIMVSPRESPRESPLRGGRDRETSTYRDNIKWGDIETSSGRDRGRGSPPRTTRENTSWKERERESPPRSYREIPTGRDRDRDRGSPPRTNRDYPSGRDRDTPTRRDRDIPTGRDRDRGRESPPRTSRDNPTWRDRERESPPQSYRERESPPRSYRERESPPRTQIDYDKQSIKSGRLVKTICSHRCKKLTRGNNVKRQPSSVGVLKGDTHTTYPSIYHVSSQESMIITRGKDIKLDRHLEPEVVDIGCHGDNSSKCNIDTLKHELGGKDGSTQRMKPCVIYLDCTKAHNLRILIENNPDSPQ